MSKKRTNKTKPSAKSVAQGILGNTLGKLEADKLQEHIRVLKFSKPGVKTKYCVCTWDLKNKGWKPQACFDSKKRAVKAMTNVSLATYYQVGLNKDVVKVTSEKKVSEKEFDKAASKLNPDDYEFVDAKDIKGDL